MLGKSELLDVVAAVICSDGYVFAARRIAGLASGGLWEFPGGKVEAGESQKEALIREIREELDVPISVGELLIEVESHDAGIRLICYRATLDGSRPRWSSDHDELGWFKPPELVGLDWAPADLPAVALISRELWLD